MSVGLKRDLLKAKRLGKGAVGRMDRAEDNALRKTLPQFALKRVKTRLRVRQRFGVCFGSIGILFGERRGDRLSPFRQLMRGKPSMKVGVRVMGAV